MRLRFPSPLVSVGTAFVLGALAACTVTFNDQLRYVCKTSADCGGDDFICAMGPTQSVCCKPTGTEVCDGRDNDCDGLVDNTNRNESCNGIDDDCNGRTDEGFDLSVNLSHCGACNHACARTEFCRGGTCIARSEGFCNDNIDDDGNGKTDCGDPSCDQRPCGTACVCSNLVKSEGLCSDAIDNEGDGETDCRDTDCTGKECRRGCLCVADAGQIEVDCTDGEDNDFDGKKDCLDPDCVGRFCTPPDIYFQCTMDSRCRCNGGVQIAEVGSVLCRDDVDNDCDGESDCGEDSCTGQSCSPDGGLGCECAMGHPKETLCANLQDDDGDGKIDCADSDCVAGTTCTKPDGGASSCSNSSCD